MNATDLNKELKFVNHSRENRVYYARTVIKNPELLPFVLQKLFEVNDKKSCKAAWLLEFVAREDLDAILPELDTFTSNMHKVHYDSAVRPVAKICENLAIAYFSKEDNLTKSMLKSHHRERIIELCFDYLITDQKIAPQAYSMTVLYLFGKIYDWIHPELIQILERNYASGSVGYQNRAAKLLDRLKKVV
ncbi:MAG: adenylosuccinate lyase [Flavobacteriaceae bacterium]|nr:adenylosuccinate lyase [Bacteroidia bacterium]NNK69899.1 adenylosuccinate lyase [Flavobacteriaceae bacterium]